MENVNDDPYVSRYQSDVLTDSKHCLNIVGNITENSPIAFWLSLLRWQGLDLNTLKNWLRHLWSTWIEYGAVEKNVSFKFDEIGSVLVSSDGAR